MKLCLSSDALPAGSLDELTRASRRRALDGLELRIEAGHGHGLDEALCTVRQQARVECLPGDHAPIVWLVLPQDVSLVMLLIWTGAAHQLGAGLILEKPVPDPPRGVKLALLHGNDPAEAAQAVAWAERHSAFTCWQVNPALNEADIQTVLSATRSTLAHVRLLGSGPEADNSASPATGVLMGRLALSGYDGSIALAPSSPNNSDAWRRWLFETRGWGCGTAAEKQARARAHNHVAI